MTQLADEGARVICTPPQGEPVLMRTLLQLDGDTLTIIHPLAVNQDALRAGHFERVSAAVRSVRRLRLSLNLLSCGCMVLPVIQIVQSLQGDWRQVFWRFAPYTFASLIGLSVRPLFMAWLRRKIARGFA